ncbi:hypothetical protein NK6_1029 [Bradyrhizobium diazoefficiens]|uniref:Uncharacterized protein n=1 Tax=Bradyrhizobium diazoefficiens TaxID=1355477 RepID=A0A0E4BK60_9BRAD|nr:hypothetical protein NK6_1029 [Bradyrhizobium diazoefficiens]
MSVERRCESGGELSQCAVPPLRLSPLAGRGRILRAAENPGEGELRQGR